MSNHNHDSLGSPRKMQVSELGTYFAKDPQPQILAEVTENDQSTCTFWGDFLVNNRVDKDPVPLFATNQGIVETLDYGHDKRSVLERSPDMESLMRKLGSELIRQFR